MAILKDTKPRVVIPQPMELDPKGIEVDKIYQRRMPTSARSGNMEKYYQDRELQKGASQMSVDYKYKPAKEKAKEWAWNAALSLGPEVAMGVPAIRGALGTVGKVFKANPMKDETVLKNVTGLLKKTYKLNPFAGKVPTTPLYRVQEEGFNPVPMLERLEEKRRAGKELNWMQESALDEPERRAYYTERDAHYGQWFENDPKRLRYYMEDKGPEGPVEILKANIRNTELPNYSVAQSGSAAARKTSMSPETEFIVPKPIIAKASKYPATKWQDLVKQHTTEPNWIRGYPKPSK